MSNVQFRITGLALREIRLPLREPFRISSGTCTERRIALVELQSDGDQLVWAECVAGELPNYSEETIDTAWLAISQWLAPRMIGREFAHPSDVAAVLGAHVCGHRMARAALEMGCWAVAAAGHGMPLARLLGGTRNRVSAGISIGIQDSPDLLAEKAAAARAQGYAKIKVKIRPGADVDYVRAARQAIGDDHPLMADANSAYDATTQDSLLALDDFGLTMIEQPLQQDDLLRHARLQARLRTPICLDESITSLERAQDMVDLGAGRVINIKPGRVGGFRASLAIHSFCQRNNIPVWCGGMLESGIGRSYNVALASLPNFTMPGDLSPSARYWERDVVSPEWTMDAAGYVQVPLGTPGIGVEVDTARIDELTVRRQVLA
jgi:o-succinylbenzoate synthase